MADDEPIRAVLARIDERTANMDRNLQAHIEADEKKHDDFEERMRKMESWKSRIGGIAIAISAVVGAVVGFAQHAIAAIFAQH